MVGLSRADIRLAHLQPAPRRASIAWPQTSVPGLAGSEIHARSGAKFNRRNVVPATSVGPMCPRDVRQDRAPELLAAIEKSFGVPLRRRAVVQRWELSPPADDLCGKADDAGVDVSRFVRSLAGRHLEEVLRAIP